MKTKNLLLLGLAALGGYALWKRANTKGVGSIVSKGLATKVMGILGYGIPTPQTDSSYQDPTQDPLYPEYQAYWKSMGGDIVYGPGQARPEVYIMRFDEWKAKMQQQQSLGGAAGLLNNRVVQGVLQNGTIVAGVGEILPPAPMEMAWQYPGLQSAHAPGRIYKV